MLVRTELKVSVQLEQPATGLKFDWFWFSVALCDAAVLPSRHVRVVWLRSESSRSGFLSPVSDQLLTTPPSNSYLWTSFCLLLTFL
jgi:hypothetical protein